LIRGSPQILIGTAWQKPEEILDALHLQRTSSVADIGADTGYFSVRIAKRIPEGKIFAADIEPVIHGAIHKARAGMAVAAMQCGLLPLQTAMRFVGHIGLHDYEGPARRARAHRAGSWAA
jgi:hypothetical protein